MRDEKAVADRLVFEQTFDGLLNKGLSDRLTTKLKTRLKALGLDLDAKLLPAYPFSVWRGMLQATAEELYPELSLESAYERLGGDLVVGFFRHPLGTAMIAMLKLIGPARAMQRAERNFRSGNNYAQTRMTPLDATHYELWVNEVSETRHNMLGILKKALELTGAPNPVVAIKAFDEASVTFDIHWGEPT